MQVTKRNHGSRVTVCTPTPLRWLAAVAAALLIGTLMVSSAAHALMLGDASAQSALGSPLRVVIPVTAAPGESLQPGCFQMLPATGDGSAQNVTGRVSLERTSTASRLVVTTTNSISEPAIRFSILGGCDRSVRRVYVVLLDPPAAGATRHVHAAATPVVARELGQERPALQLGAARYSTASGARPETQVVPVPEPAAPASPAMEPAREVSLRERVATAAALVSPTLRQVAATPPSSPPAAAPSPPPRSADGSSPWSLMAAALAVAGVIGLAALLARRREAQPEFPQWTRSPSFAGPRSFADLSSAPATFAYTLSRADAAAMPESAPHGEPKVVATAPPSEAPAAPRHIPAPVDPSMIDTLLDELNPDIVEERAVRQAWAAARSEVEREMDGDAILQAIDAAERGLLVPSAPPPPSFEHALEDDLRQPPRRR